MPEKQIKSKERVAERGEVFTAEREVNAMLDLVKQETERIDSRFLEPACGNGNFLVKILQRKLDVVYGHHTQKFGRNADKYEINLEMVIAVSSIYGVDIMEDNVEECRERLYSMLYDWYPHATKGDRLEGELSDTLKFILSRNILWGDALTLKEPVDADAPKQVKDAAKPIVFSEWSFVGSNVKRRDYTLDMLLRPRNFDGPSLFSDLGDEAFIPLPCAEYPMINFLKLYTQDAATK